MFVCVEACCTYQVSPQLFYTILTEKESHAEPRAHLN